MSRFEIPVDEGEPQIGGIRPGPDTGHVPPQNEEASMDGVTTNPYPPELKALNAAIATAQGEMPAIPKDKTVDTGTFKYEYADLASILAAVRPVLAKHGLALVQRLENPSGGGPSIRTELRHADGGCIAASFPLGEWSTPQQLGSSVTYIRRYALCAMLGIAAEEDDDGRQALVPDRPSRASGAEQGAGPSPQEGPPLKPDTGTTETPAFQAPKLKDEAEFMEDLTAAQRRQDLRHPDEADRRWPLHGRRVQGAAVHVLRSG